MANNNDSDEYELGELDEVTPDMTQEDELQYGGSPESTLHTDTPPFLAEKKDIRRNVLLAISLIVIAVIVYKFIGAMLAPKKASDADISPPVTAVSVQPTPPPAETKPVVSVSMPSSTLDNSQVGQKLSVMELGQQNIRAQVDAVNDQLGGMNANINELTSKITVLNQMISSLATKIDEQARQITILTTPKVHTRPAHHIKQGPPRTVYYIQAIIPGRAWLIATNGSTLTVREGTSIRGYGVVKLIDPNQGRIITSSGQVIKFSQQDS